MGNFSATPPASPTANMASAELSRLISSSAVLVLSKTTCPYCRRAKGLLGQVGARNVTVVELDSRADGSALQDAAYDLTKQVGLRLLLVLSALTCAQQRTVPNIFIGGKHVGGSDSLAELHSQGKLETMLKQASSL
jgi:glutaredoxin 3